MKLLMDQHKIVLHHDFNTLLVFMIAGLVDSW